MNRIVVSAAVAAIVATVCALVTVHFTKPEVVRAAPTDTAGTAGTRIALVNIEEVSRKSPQFAQSQADWRNAKAETNARLTKLKDEYDVLYAQIKKVGDTDSDEGLYLRVQLQSVDEEIKASKKEFQAYLSALLDQYQREVLKEVMKNVKRYADQAGFDLVLQTYTVNESEEDFFSGGSYADSVMSQAVLYAPGADELKNAHVTDITEKMVHFMRHGGVPEAAKPK